MRMPMRRFLNVYLASMDAIRAQRQVDMLLAYAPMHMKPGDSRKAVNDMQKRASARQRRFLEAERGGKSARRQRENEMLAGIASLAMDPTFGKFVETRRVPDD